jgi:putative intracellular protease/amidase
MEEERHHRPVRQVAGDLVGDVDVLEPRDVLDRAEACDRVAAARRPKEIAENPVAPGVGVDEPAADDAADVKPLLLAGGDGRAEEVHVLHDAKGLDAGELGEGVEDGTRAEREADEGDRPDADVPVKERIGEDKTRRLGTVERVRPRVVDQVAQLGEDCARGARSRQI